MILVLISFSEWRVVFGGTTSTVLQHY